MERDRDRIRQAARLMGLQYKSVPGFWSTSASGSKILVQCTSAVRAQLSDKYDCINVDFEIFDESSCIEKVTTYWTAPGPVSSEGNIIVEHGRERKED